MFISSILAAFTLAAAVGAEAPELLEPFPTHEACLSAKATVEAQLRDELEKNGVALVCLRIDFADT